jgi:predicted RNA-binding Zn ribbon-like protein
MGHRTPQLVKSVLMETQVPRELPIVGGHLALDFANTVDDPDGRARHDHIATYPDLLRWSARIGVLSSAGLDQLESVRPRAAATALARAHALRDTINATFAEPSTASDHWGQLRPYAIDALAHSQLVPAGEGYELGWPEAGDPAAMLWPIAHAAAGLLTAPELRRVKHCGGCPWLFVDRSKNGSRRWCAMNDCGTHQKITRYVARRAARRQGGRS